MAKKLSTEDFDRLLAFLQAEGYETYGPKLRDAAVVYDTIDSSADMPIGYIDEQQGGIYRLHKTDRDTLFAYVVGPDSWKRFMFPKREVLFKAEIKPDGIVFNQPMVEAPKRAFIGVRPCELAAIGVQDNVFIHSDFKDAGYGTRRTNLLTIAVNCTRSASTCFCASVDTGPSVTSPKTNSRAFDLALTEVLQDDSHFLLLDIGSEFGQSIVDALKFSDASQADIDLATGKCAEAAASQRGLATENLNGLISNNLENTNFWQQVGDRCLSCGNCTQVCPTCFCSNIEEETDLSGENSERVRYWDSCFNASHSYVVGSVVREEGASRYRQWMYHKLASWQDQFNELGCTGCGRCVTWCPVGIDLREEVNRLQVMGSENATIE